MEKTYGMTEEQRAKHNERMKHYMRKRRNTYDYLLSQYNYYKKELEKYECCEDFKKYHNDGINVKNCPFCGDKK